ncbi:DUF3644 domain-containing protein [Campylobacter lari]|nr:DUF3644 domain-containing protein [Campylobacter lari]
MPKSKYNVILEKSIQAALSAIELYNKPNFTYREESFCILMTNAWELLLKAKILKDNNNKLNSLYIPESIKTKKGVTRKKITYKKNRAGNYLTIGLSELIQKEIQDGNLKAQLEILIAIRDNAIHFFNNNYFNKQVLQIATASLKNYKILIEEWFNKSLDNYDLFLIPLAFNIPESFSAGCPTKEQQNLLQFIAQKIQHLDETSPHDIALVVDIKFNRSQGGIPAKISPEGIPIYQDSEDVFKNKYPLNYTQLIQKIKGRYENFKQNGEFHRIKKELQKNERFYSIRYLDFNNENGQKKGYYSTEILKEFDKHYKRKRTNND